MSKKVRTMISAIEAKLRGRNGSSLVQNLANELTNHMGSETDIAVFSTEVLDEGACLFSFEVLSEGGFNRLYLVLDGRQRTSHTFRRQLAKRVGPSGKALVNGIPATWFYGAAIKKPNAIAVEKLVLLEWRR